MQANCPQISGMIHATKLSTSFSNFFVEKMSTISVHILAGKLSTQKLTCTLTSYTDTYLHTHLATRILRTNIIRRSSGPAAGIN